MFIYFRIFQTCFFSLYSKVPSCQAHLASGQMREGIGDRRQKQEVQPPMDPVLMRLDYAADFNNFNEKWDLN